MLKEFHYGQNFIYSRGQQFNLKLEILLSFKSLEQNEKKNSLPTKRLLKLFSTQGLNIMLNFYKLFIFHPFCNLLFFSKFECNHNESYPPKKIKKEFHKSMTEVRDNKLYL